MPVAVLLLFFPTVSVVYEYPSHNKWPFFDNINNRRMGAVSRLFLELQAAYLLFLLYLGAHLSAIILMSHQQRRSDNVLMECNSCWSVFC